MLDKRDYFNISVKELCEKAGINRRTFYLHFDSVDEVLLYIQHDIATKFYHEISSSSKVPYSKELIISVFKTINSDPFLELLVLNQTNEHIRDRILVLVRSYLNSNNPGNKIRDTFEKKTISTIYYHILVSTYTEWSKQKKTIPMEQAAEIAYRFVSKGVNSEQDS